ncbi:MerR family transcriptional regulator [Jeotgalibacillus marinus]|uniref:MerR family transcriptional regulator n=1 Tax=Jeotgalibacillus marinus TaxID=86667 RepID=A0ABV3Q724_9BACL
MTLVSTGELARQLHVSVRTLRYYDQIGLVPPSRKDENGKRFYSEDDILRLEKILLLKSLSLSLEDSKKILSEKSTHAIVTAHKAVLEQQRAEIEQSILQTTSLIHTIELEGTIDWKALLTLVVNQEKERDWQSYFSEEEHQILAEQLPKLENDDLTTKKWMNLLKRIELCVQTGETPQSEIAQLIVDDIEILSHETFNGDEELMEKFWEVRKSKEKSEELGLYPIDERILIFLDQAIVYADKVMESG